MSCTDRGALASNPSPEQHCRPEQGPVPGSALILSRLRGRRKVPSSSTASGCKAPPGTVLPAPTSAGLRLLQQCQPLRGQILLPTGPCLSISPSSFYKPSVASPRHGSFTDVTADLLYKIFPPVYLCLCFVVVFLGFLVIFFQ